MSIGATGVVGSFNATPWWTPPTPSRSVTKSGSLGVTQSNQASSSSQQSASAQQAASQGSAFSQSYIPDYAESPILRSVAQQAQNMAPEVYQWGMNEYNKNQGNIDSMMRNAMTYASPQRIASEMGRAEAGVQQGAEAGRQSAIKDLQSFGIDPSSGRYAALDTASRVVAGAQAAGAGNQQREATVGQGAQMTAAAQDASEKNYATGYGASNAATGLLGTAMQLKYPPLGNVSGSQQSSQSSGSTMSSGSTSSSGSSSGINKSYGSTVAVGAHGGGAAGGGVSGGSRPMIGQADAGGGADPTTGGFVSQELSPSAGAQTDDVQARLNSGEFVIPKDVAAWKGQEFFYKLMAQARKLRATAGSESNGMGMQENGNGGGQQSTLPQESGYARGGSVREDPTLSPEENVRRADMRMSMGTEALGQNLNDLVNRKFAIQDARMAAGNESTGQRLAQLGYPRDVNMAAG